MIYGRAVIGRKLFRESVINARGRRAQAETSDAETLGGTRYVLHVVKRAVKVLHAMNVPQSAENVGAPVMATFPRA